jgi:2-keto-4-pentenoate hydratase/2-oxohepta-3-ene-1,7-dioic acid hydratase in catechol pathway
MNYTRVALVLATSLISGYPCIYAQTAARPREPFKLGTFEQRDRVFIGVVLRDAQVIDVARANEALERGNPAGKKLAIPSDMKEFIARYEAGLKERVYAIVNAAAGTSSALQYVYSLRDLRVLPPVRPVLLLNAGGNYSEHTKGVQQQGRDAVGGSASGAAPLPKSIPGIWERKPDDERVNPYIFLKAPSAVIGNGESIRVPPGRTQIDYECEFDVVIGKPARHVPLDRAADYIFGYTIQNDVSDREARGDGRFGSDWLIAKDYDTFAPLGPYIVPKEFIKDPMNLRQTLTLNGEMRQDSNTSRMDLSIYEMLQYGSNILTLSPGDIISMGSPPGTNLERSNPRWMRSGDTVVCTIEGIGSMTNPVAE